MDMIPFSLKREYFQSREHSYLVDMWFGTKGGYHITGGGRTIPRELAGTASLMEECGLGRSRAKKGVQWMYDKGWLTSDAERKTYRVELPRDAPFVKVRRDTCREIVGALDERQVRAYLWCKQRKRLAEIREETCEVAPVWLVRDLGLSECNNNRAGIARTLGELEGMGLIETEASPYGKMTIVRKVAEEWKRSAT